MDTVSTEKYFNTVSVKKRTSPLKSHNRDGSLVCFVSDSFVFLEDTINNETKPLFPVSNATYIDFEVIDDNYIFIIVDSTGTTCQVRNFIKGSLTSIHIDTDTLSIPQLILVGDKKGIFFSYEEKVIFMEYSEGVLRDQVDIKPIPGEYLDYAVYDPINKGAKLVTKVFNHDMIHPSISTTERKEKDFTEIPLSIALEENKDA